MIKEIALNKTKTLTIIGLTAIAVILPLISHTQSITGPLVNACLFLAVILVGIEGALLVGLLPSTIALAFGIVPSLLLPILPFIIISNALLVISFNAFKENFLPAVLISSVLKFLFLFSVSSIIINLLKLPEKMASIFSWPQLLTALTGGLIAFLIIKIVKQ